MLKGFRDFISRGNAIDLAVGVVIGAAFTALVNAFVANLINPILGAFGTKSLGDYVLCIHDVAGQCGPVGDKGAPVGVYIGWGRDRLGDHHLPAHRGTALLRVRRPDEQVP